MFLKLLLTNTWRVMKPLLDTYAWIMIIIGTLLFTARVPLPPNDLVNLPVLVTLLQITGGIFIISGFSLVVTRLFWYKVSYDVLQQSVLRGNVAAGLTLMGLKIFAGMTVIACALWLALAFNGGGR